MKAIKLQLLTSSSFNRLRCVEAEYPVVDHIWIHRSVEEASQLVCEHPQDTFIVHLKFKLVNKTLV